MLINAHLRNAQAYQACTKPSKVPLPAHPPFDARDFRTKCPWRATAVCRQRSGFQYELLVVIAKWFWGSDDAPWCTDFKPTNRECIIEDWEPLQKFWHERITKADPCSIPRLCASGALPRRPPWSSRGPGWFGRMRRDEHSWVQPKSWG